MDYMKKKQLGNLFKTTLLFCILMLTSCQPRQNQPEQDTNSKSGNWKTFLEENLPLLGHRNWIVVTDMAYPLQTNPDIITMYATEPYHEVIKYVDDMIEKAPHVFAHIYRDQEQQVLSEKLAPGWDDYKASLSQVLDFTDVQSVPHEELIARLDEVSCLYRVIIIKTSLTVPYTSLFFELDCGYWDAQREKKIRE